MIVTCEDFLPSVSDVVSEHINETVTERKVFYRLGESELFNFANNNTVVNGEKLINVIPRMVVKDQGFLQVDLNKFDKTVLYEIFEGPRYKLSCKKAMLQLLSSGAVNMVYSAEYKVPTCIPYVVQGSGSAARVFVNISDFVDVDTYGNFQVTQARNYNALMSALFAACAAYRIVNMSATLPTDIADGLVLMYSGMLEGVIHSLLHLDPISREKVKYLATQFALVQMYGTENGQKLFFRYRDKYFPKLSKIIMDSIDNQFRIDNYDKLSMFITELVRIYPSMKSLTDYKVYTKWISRYGASTAMSIDYLGYHLYTVCMVLFESPLIMRVALEPVMEKNRGTDMYRRLQNLIGV